MATTTTGHPGRTLIVLGRPGRRADHPDGRQQDLDAEARTRPAGRHHDHVDGAEHLRQRDRSTRTACSWPKTIIQNRVDSLGVGESEVITAGDKQLIVTVPNVQQDELVRLVGQTARAAVPRRATPPSRWPPPAPEPTATGSPSPERRTHRPADRRGDSLRLDRRARESRSRTAQSGNNRPFPALPTAPPQPPARRAQSADGAGHAARQGDGVGADREPARPRSRSSPATRSADDVPDQAAVRLRPGPGPRSTCSARP